MEKTLIVITGPTGVGKTQVAIEVAQRLQCHIISADSRQIYRDIPIATAAPTARQLALVPHHLVGFKALNESYNAWQFEQDVMALLPSLWQESDYAVLCGGSMMYVDAVCNGIDDMPSVPPEVRTAVDAQLVTQGLASLLQELERLDPAYFATVDRRNVHRVKHAVEMCRATGKPFSSMRTGQRKERPFKVVKVGLTLERPLLFHRINSRVDAMMQAGLEEEARRTYPLRTLNSLNTVGLKEMYAVFDGTMDMPTAIERIKKNTRVYAKKQLTWFRRDAQLLWMQPHECLERLPL